MRGEASRLRILRRTALIPVLCLTLATPSRAESLTTARNQLIAGLVVVGVVITVLTTLVILHHKHKPSAITGCVRSGASGMSLTDEKDKRTYALSGNPVGLKPGDRVTLEGKPNKTGEAFVFEAQWVAKDFGACQS
jgi:hypothetical protein